MATHVCTQEKEISAIRTQIALLNQNKIEYMEKLDKLENKVDNWFEKVFDRIDWLVKSLDYKYYTKDEAKSDNLLQSEREKAIKEKIDNHQSIIQRITRAIVLWVLATVWTAIITVLKNFNS